MKRYFHFYICLVLSSFSSFSYADDIDNKYSIDARYVYTFGYRVGQSLVNKVNKTDIDQLTKGVRGYLQNKQPKPSSDETDSGNVSTISKDYEIGYQIGQSLITQGIKKPNIKILIEGIYDSLQGNKPGMDEIEMHDALSNYQAYQKALRKNNSKANKADAEIFLSKNRKRSTVIEMPSGLQYETIRPAQGIQTDQHNLVKVHYHGTFIDGTVFDSSVLRDKPSKFRLNQIIPGLAEALSKMREGEKWRIYVPPELGYGLNGVKGSIGPNELLIFEIELLEILNS